MCVVEGTKKHFVFDFVSNESSSKCDYEDDLHDFLVDNNADENNEKYPFVCVNRPEDDDVSDVKSLVDSIDTILNMFPSNLFPEESGLFANPEEASEVNDNYIYEEKSKGAPLSVSSVSDPRKRKQAGSLREKVERNHEKYPLLDPCSNKCKRHCVSFIKEDERATINATFNSFSFSERRQWLDKYVCDGEIK